MKSTKSWMKTSILFCGITLAACTNDDNPVVPPADDVEEQLAQMTLREKVGQMFYVRPEALDTTIHWTSHTELMPLELR